MQVYEAELAKAKERKYKSEKENAWATKIQWGFRGKRDRKKVKEKRKEKGLAPDPIPIIREESMEQPAAPKPLPKSALKKGPRWKRKTRRVKGQLSPGSADDDKNKTTASGRRLSNLEKAEVAT